MLEPKLDKQKYPFTMVIFLLFQVLHKNWLYKSMSDNIFSVCVETRSKGLYFVRGCVSSALVSICDGEAVQSQLSMN